MQVKEVSLTHFDREGLATQRAVERDRKGPRGAGSRDGRIPDAAVAVHHGSQVISEEPRCAALANGLLSHLAHHRGQLTVYLRLLGASVPVLYGPSADEQD